MEGVVDARFDGQGVTGCGVNDFPFEGGALDAGFDGEGFDLILVPVVGWGMDCRAGVQHGAHSVGRGGVIGEEFGASTTVFGGDRGEVRLLRARRLSVEKREHYGVISLGFV